MFSAFSQVARILLLLLPLLLSSACTIEPSESQQEQPAPEESSLPLSVSLGDVSLNKTPFIIAREERLYSKYGLDVEIKLTSRAAGVVADSQVPVRPEFVGDIERPDIRIGGGTPTIVSRTTNVRSLDRVILATTDPVVRWHIFAGPEIASPEQLKGKRLGVSGYGAMTDFCARLFAIRMGWDPQLDISIMQQSLGVKYLQEGRVDAFIADETAMAKAMSAGLEPLVDLGEWSVPIAGSGVVVERIWLQRPGNRDKALRFLKALVEAISLLKTDERYVFNALEKWYGITDPEEKRRIYLSGNETMPRKPYPAVAGIEKTMEIYDYHEMRQHKAEDFYDDSLIRELDESGFIDQFYP